MRELRDLLLRGDGERIAALAVDTKRVLGGLTALTYDPDPLVAWRAVEGMGLAAARIAEEDPDSVREHLRRLHWLLSEESGGICWRAPEAMAEIVRRCPDWFGDYVPIVVHLIVEMAEEDLRHFRAGVLWAIGRLGRMAAEHVPAVLPALLAALDDPDPQVRGSAVWCLGQVGRGEVLADRRTLDGDAGVVDLYEGCFLKRTTVAALAQRAVSSTRGA
jgi:HEAT repeat protein